MKPILALFLPFLLILGCKDGPKQLVDQNNKPTAEVSPKKTSNNFGIVIHGGAGTILKANMDPELEERYKAKLEEAIRTGYGILENGGSSLDAVEKTINILEDSPLFNAGKGAVFTHDKKNELDASIMDGQSLNAGAVASVTTVKNPISLARAVMEKSDHVLLACEGAEEFAVERGFEPMPPSYFYTEKRMKSLEGVLEREKSSKENKSQASFFDPYMKNEKFGTVGCTALDKNGNLAAGTSTGGMSNKRWGRIGDSPIIGAGTYANNNTCAISSTGWGEFFIRGVVAYDISALMEYKGLSLQEATREVIQNKLSKLGGDGGVVAIDGAGNVSMEFNTAGMFRASMDKNGKLYIGMYNN
ncbi:isoaspartyl peptidase/L-asparaginase [Flavobacteriaceae bacterium F89]|uniref:Isoaspartyl peptidase n=1 Tax=Cerina litoralis TaxID=2874477 RepID=A0AAE3EVT2_9FLAO|nr:isoaspartyl peptidase/L-asparaginase [Cerina litoralis]MCG2461515.1 isoaspartyl peptidase/L-asparaginase [Cerina litoralis]